MLTLLFLIHRWFYSTTPKNHTQICSTTKEKPIIEEEKNQISQKNCQLQPSFCSHFSLLAVCKFSSTVVVAGVEPLRKSSEVHKMSIEEKFRAAVRVIHSLPKDGPYQPSNTTKLKFYGLYKQATEGKNVTPKPGFWDVISRAKWEAWNKLGDMSKDAAMNEYVDGLKEIVETMSFNGEVEDFLDSIGPFYEFVTLQGNEMKDIKEKIEEFSSSNSSLANSIANSAANSKESSPVKTLQNGHEDEEEEEEVSTTSDKAEVIVETSSVTYESKNHHKKVQSLQNGDAIKMGNGDYSKNNPPPAPRHSYSNLNGHVNHALPNDHDEDEVLTVSTSYNVSCKEDLEQDIEVGNNGNSKVKMASSIETVATSGTESEKYYSGDSDPEMEEKYASYLANKDCFPSTSAACLVQQQQRQLVNAKLVHDTHEGSHNLKKSMNSLHKKSFKEYVSPKNNPAIMNAADVATQQTIERLNRDVDHILARLRILETAYAASAEGAMRVSSNQNESGRRKRRVFGDLSPQSIAFIVMWPFVVQFLIKLIRWWWRRRRNLRSITH